MDPLRIRYQTIEFPDVDIHVRSLRDKQEFHDPEGVAEALGISSANWSLFGVVWPSSQALARLMSTYQIEGRRILEVGCGLGLASLVLNERGADITATDYHPEAGVFLQANTELNGANDIPFARSDWKILDSDIGEFDLIIASEVLYERGHVDDLSAFIDRHAKPTCEVIVIDPGRGETGRFSKRMIARGFEYTRTKAHPGDRPKSPYSGQLHRFLR